MAKASILLLLLLLKMMVMMTCDTTMPIYAALSQGLCSGGLDCAALAIVALETFPGTLRS